jgi:hypothetical protein
VKAAVAQTAHNEDGGCRLGVVFACGPGASDYGAVLGDVASQRWVIMHSAAGGVRFSRTATADECGSRLHAHRFCTVRIRVRGEWVSVDVDDRAVFEGVQSTWDLAGGEAGVLAGNFRTVVRRFTIGPPGSSGCGGSSLRSDARATPRSISAVRGTAAASPRASADPRTAAAVVAASGVDASPSATLTASLSAAKVTAGTAAASTAAAVALAPRPPRYAGGDPRLVEALEANIVPPGSTGVALDDIVGLVDAKRAIHEAIVLPLLVPEFFTGVRVPWRGVLLFGPPGTGKTMIARAAAQQIGATFFNCNAASLVSKWRGESEKLVATLFAMARHYAPSIIFLDEVDALVASRGDGSEHEASRRMKSVLLTEMDGVAPRAGQQVMVLAATNTCVCADVLGHAGPGLEFKISVCGRH